MRIKIFNRKTAILAAALCLTSVVILLQLQNIDTFKNKGDGPSYRAMAEGITKDVYYQHQRRFLHPLVVRCLKPFLGTDNAFLAVGTAGVFSFLLVVLILLHGTIKFPLWPSVALIFLPYLFYIFEFLYTQTFFFLLLSSIYYLLVIHKRYVSGMFIMFLMFLTRFEEAAVLAFCFIVALIIKSCSEPKKSAYYFYVILTAAVSGLGLYITAHATRAANFNGLPFLVSYLFRIPSFYVANFTGIRHWLDTYQNLPLMYTHPPLVVWDAPLWLRNISIIKQIGIYEWRLTYIIATWASIFSIFGTGPTIVLYLIKKGTLNLSKRSLAFNTTFLSGLVMFMLAPGAGPASLEFIRYYLSAWPLFFIILPLFLKDLYRLDKALFSKIIFCYMVSGWLLALQMRAPGTLFCGMIIIGEIILHWYTWRALSLTAGPPIQACSDMIV